MINFYEPNNKTKTAKCKKMQLQVGIDKSKIIVSNFNESLSESLVKQTKKVSSIENILAMI